jgi:flagellar biosynthesis/type III secretory pathway M-ring protein FliF/YscJ
MMGMPQESIWLQFAIVSIVILAIGAIWRELTKFVREQDEKRDEEREKQRIWQSQQDLVRDERWQEFLRNMQDELISQHGRNNEAIREMLKKVEQLMSAVNDHDRFTREAIIAMRERTTR